MNRSGSVVRFYLDPISPYVFLALGRLRASGEESGIEWRLRPIVYAKLLEAHGLVGPVESEAKRRYTMLDLVRCARREGLEVLGPPAHPFRSLSALRVLSHFASSKDSDPERDLNLAEAVVRAAWADGRDLEQWPVLEDVVRSVGLDAKDLEARATAPSVKQRLIQSTSEAVERGVFGVPTFEYEGELFWGHDRMDQLLDRVRGTESAPDAADIDRILARPIGVRRPR